jgi:hypothetical protein
MPQSHEEDATFDAQAQKYQQVRSTDPPCKMLSSWVNLPDGSDYSLKGLIGTRV